MKQQLIQATRVAVNSTTEEYGNTFRSIARSIGGYLALLFTAGLMTGEYIRRYWQSFERWSASWSGDPFVVEPEPEPELVMAVAAPAKPPVKPPAPPKPVAKSRKRSAKNAHRTTAAGFAVQ